MQHVILEASHQPKTWKLLIAVLASCMVAGHRWTYLDDRTILIPRQRVALNPIWPLKIGPNAIRARLDFWFLVEDNGTNRVQCNGIPHKLKAMLVPLGWIGFAFQELSCRDGSIHLEAIVFADHIAVRWVANWKAKVMKNRCRMVSFRTVGCY